MRTGNSKKFISKISIILLVILLGIAVFSGCRVGYGAAAKGWSGGVIDNGVLFVGSMDGKLAAANITDGRLMWSIPLESEEESGGGFGCAQASTAVAIYGSPAVAGDLVYVGGYNGKIYAFKFNRDNLKDRPIQVPREIDYSGPIIGGIAVAMGKVYFSTDNGKVYALNAADGSMAWDSDAEDNDKIWSTPAISGDTLYIGSFNKKLYALNTSDGSKKWEYEAEGAIVSTPVVHNNTVYFGSFDRCLYALDAADGSLKWKFPEAKKWFWAKAVVHNDTVYAACLDGKVYALDARSGNEKLAFDLGSPISSSPVLVDDLLIVATEEGGIYALDADSNRQRQLANLEEKVYAPLIAGEGKVYVHTDADALYEIDVQTGAEREFDIKE
jgi:outer membrane protein assembly factor BamB